jgi:hypothetical protein
MLEACTTLGFLAGVTERVRLHALVTAVVYREPGLLARIVTTRDDLLRRLRGSRETGFTVAYIFGKNPDPLATVELLSSVVPEIADW